MKLLKTAFCVAALSASAFSQAYSIVTTTSHDGVIHAIDQSAGRVQVLDKQGSMHDLAISEATDLRLNQRAESDLARLEPGQAVSFKLKTLTPASEPLAGTVMKVYKDSQTVRIAPQSGRTPVEVQLAPSVKVHGLAQVNSFEQLKPGYEVLIKSIDN